MSAARSVSVEAGLSDTLFFVEEKSKDNFKCDTSQ